MHRHPQPHTHVYQHTTLLLIYSSCEFPGTIVIPSINIIILLIITTLLHCYHYYVSTVQEVTKRKR